MDFADELDALITRAKEAGVDLDDMIAELDAMVAGLEAEGLG